MDETLFATSSLLSAAGVVHGFSLRTGGVSAGPFSSLNLSRAVGDEPAAVEENLRRLARAAGLRDSKFMIAKQVHGDRVMVARHGAGGVGLEELLPASEPGAAAVSGEKNLSVQAGAGEPEADAIVTRTPALLAAVRVADCTPILIFSPDARAAAAVHSGWRGAKLSIAARGAGALESYGAVRSGLLAAIGPCIGRCCYAVSKELAASFRALFGPEVADDPDFTEVPHLDLRACAATALLRAGLTPERIEQVPGCTACSPELFYSHRRDQGRTGRHLAFIAV